MSNARLPQIIHIGHPITDTVTPSLNKHLYMTVQFIVP